MSRPAEDLRRLLHDCPELPQFVNEIYQAKTVGKISWPSWCFMPVAVWSKLAELEYDSGESFSLSDLSAFISFVPSVGTWRYSQGIYRFAPELLAALKETPVTGDLPAEVLLRLPEWAIYVETPGFQFYGRQVDGFYASLDYNLQHNVPELRLMFAVPPVSYQTLSLVLDDSALDKTLANLRKFVNLEDDIKKTFPELTEPEKAAAISKRFVDELSPFISLLLYICSDKPEIDDLRGPGSSPRYASARKTKRGWRLFPAEKERIWTVGQILGAKLRQLGKDDGTLHERKGRTIRTHLRRGHWHGVWTRPRKGSGEQKFKLNWWAPMIIAPKKFNLPPSSTPLSKRDR